MILYMEIKQIRCFDEVIKKRLANVKDLYFRGF